MNTFDTCSVVLICWSWFVRSVEMEGRNDTTIVNAMTAMAQALTQANAKAMQGQKSHGGVEELRLDRVTRNHPPTFKGRYDLEGAQTWFRGIDKIFRAMVTTEDQKVRLATHILVEKAEFWSMNSRWRLEAGGAACRNKMCLTMSL